MTVIAAGACPTPSLQQPHLNVGPRCVTHREGGTVTVNSITLLDGVRFLILSVWYAHLRRDPIPRRDNEDCFRSFNLEGPLTERYRWTPDFGFIIRGLECLERSLMGVASS